VLRNSFNYDRTMILAEADMSSVIYAPSHAYRMVLVAVLCSYGYSIPATQNWWISKLESEISTLPLGCYANTRYKITTPRVERLRFSVNFGYTIRTDFYQRKSTQSPTEVTFRWKSSSWFFCGSGDESVMTRKRHIGGHASKLQVPQCHWLVNYNVLTYL